jgi:hypothetical protein
VEAVEKCLPKWSSGLFFHPSWSNDAAKAILKLFSRSSGLLVNYAKSLATLLQCEPDDTVLIVETLRCQSHDRLGVPILSSDPLHQYLDIIVLIWSITLSLADSAHQDSYLHRVHTLIIFDKWRFII